MGIEYRIKFEQKGAAQTDKILRALPNFAGFNEEWQTYNYCEEGNTGKMPNAEIKLEAAGIYLCDYGMSKQQFGNLVTELLFEFRRIIIEDNET